MAKYGRARAKFGQARRSKGYEKQYNALEARIFAVKWRRGVKNCHGMQIIAIAKKWLAMEKWRGDKFGKAMEK